MSLEAVSDVIARALLDAEFRGQLFAEPAAALAQYDLTEEERTALGKMKPEALDAFSSQLEERISKVTPINLPYTPDGGQPEPIPTDLTQMVSREIGSMLMGGRGVTPIFLP